MIGFMAHEKNIDVADATADGKTPMLFDSFYCFPIHCNCCEFEFEFESLLFLFYKVFRTFSIKIVLQQEKEIQNSHVAVYLSTCIPC